MRRTLDLALSPARAGRLGDFSLAGRLGPFIAFAIVAVAIYAWDGWDTSMKMLVKLWLAYAIAFLGLAALAKIKGTDAPWPFVLPTAIGGVVLGGLAGAAIALAPFWALLLEPSRLLSEAWVGAAFAAFFVGLSLVTAEVRRRDQAVTDARRQLLEARLQALTAQIEPHFLMNTLANLRYLIKTDGPAAAEMLEHLADFLEGSLERSRALHSTLGQEIKLVESYLSIMRIRLGTRLRFVTDVPAELEQTPFPPLLLQTLVENAVVHGIEPHGGKGTIAVTARREGARIAIRVTDDGVGLDAARPRSDGLGLQNTRERLATFYAGRASFELTGGAPSGAVAAISIPAEA
jgi:hypothetical protein